MDEHASEVAQGERFQFGKNWSAFLSVLDDDRIVQAENSLKEYLELGSLEGLTFLDIGSGSGLFSLSARRLGATVHSFDYDPQSVECTRELKRRYFADDARWTVEQASALDSAHMAGLGEFDIVYSWGVLHHTGEMYQALGNAARSVKRGGLLFIAIYNYQKYWTAAHTRLKRAYNRAPSSGKWLVAGPFICMQASRGLMKDLLLLRNPLRRYRDRDRKMRGMSIWYDWIDWVGGYPFEVARPEQVFDYYRKQGFSLRKLRTAGSGHGCNEFVFRRSVESSAAPPASRGQA